MSKNKVKPRIIPEVKKCKNCKKRPVENHHWFCDICYGKKQKKKNLKEQEKFLKKNKSKFNKPKDWGKPPK